jgi:hypothetical protein
VNLEVPLRLDAESLDRLAERLAELDAAGLDASGDNVGDDVARAALRAIGAHPRLISGLDCRARAVRLTAVRSAPTGRRTHWAWSKPAERLEYRPAAEVYGMVSARFGTSRSKPISTVFASFDRDGRVRERAVRAMGAAFLPEYAPFVIPRTADWARPVRDAARAVVLARPDFLAAMLPMAVYVSRRDHGRWVFDHLHRLVRAQFDQFGPLLLASRETYARRLGFEIARERGLVHYAEHVRRAGHDGDPIIRGWAVKTACAEAARRGDRETLRLLAGSRFAGVRIEALVSLAELGHDEDVTAALTDPAALVRAYARSRSSDAPAHYRVAVTTAPAPGSIAGLGETGGPPPSNSRWWPQGQARLGLSG